jgi:hypothetical protein
MSMPGNDQRDAITMALMGINNPAPQKQLPQMPPQNLSQGMSALGGAIGGMGQPAPQAGMPMPIAPPQPMPQAGPPVGAAPQMPPQLPQGPQGIY